MKKKVAIIFFGLTRSLEKNIDSMKENLFNELDKNSIQYDIFIHTYKIYGEYINERAGENTENYKNEDVEKLLEPKFFLWDDQKTIEDSINFDNYYKKLGQWTGGETAKYVKQLIKNMVLALYSKKQITLIFEKEKDNYDFAIIMRPDMFLDDKINIKHIMEQLNENNIIIPKKGWFRGCNDQFVISKPKNIIYYGTLFDDLQPYSEKKSIVSEVYLYDKLKEKNITILPFDIKYHLERYK